MKVIKRNGEEQDFNLEKITNAIQKANMSVAEDERMSDEQLQKVVNTAQGYLKNFTSVKVEDIQDIVEKALVRHNKYQIAKNYILYRYDKLKGGKYSLAEQQILTIIDGSNAEMRSENANKHLDTNATVRDYIAGTTCKTLAEKLLPAHIVEAHKKKLIHFHDMDYSPAMNLTNCCLVNVEDMFTNGFQMGDVHIDTPHRFSTAANLLAQINAQVSSAQYGGQTVSWAHLVPFVESTRVSCKAQILDIFSKLPWFLRLMLKPFVGYIAERLVRHDIATGIKTYQYQTLSCYTANGQTPFVSNVLNLREAETERAQKDLAIIIEEILKRRIKGVKDKSGQFVGPLFPKLLYFTCDGLNVNEKDPYYYLTKLAAKCITLRMQPDIMSEKKTRETKSGQMIACMGSVAKDEVVTYKLGDKILVESIERMWNRLEELNSSKEQAAGSKDRYIALKGVSIYDNKLRDFVDCSCITKNWADKFIRVSLGGRVIETTLDHKFETENRGEVFGYDLKIGDKILISDEQPHSETVAMDTDIAWLYGMIICDSSYVSTRVVTSLDMEGEDDIRNEYVRIMHDKFNLTTQVIAQHRKEKGNYYDLLTKSGELTKTLVRKFGGLQKVNRHLPSEVFNWPENARLSLLAGMIDADGYIHHSDEVLLGSINKELALQEAKLAQSLGYVVKIRRNFYKGKTINTSTRLVVSFSADEKLINAMRCQKKKNHYQSDVRHLTQDSVQTVNLIENIDRADWSYDVTTSSEHFEVSGIYSHNCRSFLAPVWEDIRYPMETKFHWQWINDNNKKYEGAYDANFDYSRGFGCYSSLPVLSDEYMNGEHVVINFAGNSGWIKEFDKDRKEIIVRRPKVYGRFNMGVVTINLPHAALTAVENVKNNPELDLNQEFYRVLDSRLDLCHEALLERWKSVQRIKAKNSPIMWMHGAICRLQPEAKVADYVQSRQDIAQTSISLGYIGLCETCWAIKGVSNTTDEGRMFCKEALNYINKKLSDWKGLDRLGLSIYGTPEESLTTNAAAALQRDFGFVEHITDKDYVVNSYHVDPREPIDAFRKLEIEGEYLDLSAGGAVSYIETADLTNNPEAIETVIKYMHEHIMYAEVNRKIGVCYKCGHQGDFKLDKTTDGNFVFTCPECGNQDDNEMNITCRLCGYIGQVNASNTSKGRLDDIYNRVIHLE